MPVAGPQVHEIAVTSGMDLLRGAPDSRVKAVIETDLDHAPRVVLTLDQPVDLRRGHSRRLLEQNMRTGLQRLFGQPRKLSVDDSDDDDLGVHREQILDPRARASPVALGELARRLLVDVVAGEQLVLGPERGGALGPDKSTPDYRDAPRAHAYSLACAPSNSKSNASSGAPAAAIAWRVSSGLGE